MKPWKPSEYHWHPWQVVPKAIVTCIRHTCNWITTVRGGNTDISDKSATLFHILTLLYTLTIFDYQLPRRKKSIRINCTIHARNLKKNIRKHHIDWQESLLFWPFLDLTKINDQHWKLRQFGTVFLMGMYLDHMILISSAKFQLSKLGA
jgi:hypothetical protein